MPATQVKLAQLKQDSATANQVIAWSATTGWTPTTLSSGGTSSGSLGTIQYSNGSGGFSGDSTKLFWNTTTQSLQITGTASAYAGTFTGDGGGLSITQATNLTANYTAINVSGNNTASIRQLISNNNTGVSANAFINLSTQGGDPYISFTPGPGDTSNIVIGADNSATGDPFYISRGSNPSSLSGPQLKLDANVNTITIASGTNAAYFSAVGTAANILGTTISLTAGASTLNMSNASFDIVSAYFSVLGPSTFSITSNQN